MSERKDSGAANVNGKTYARNEDLADGAPAQDVEASEAGHPQPASVKVIVDKETGVQQPSAQVNEQEQLALAVVEGNPLTKLPDDLYIPPDALEVFLESFQGPLDLLLYLIKRQNMDILNINVFRITTQYMEYIRIIEDMRFELAAEYLVMAAMLAEIKSRCLLPKRESDDAEESDPRADLIRRLQEYERFKTAAETIDELPRVERDIAMPLPATPETRQVKKYPDICLNELLFALRDVLKRSELFEHHQVEKERLSTRERMSQILVMLSPDSFTEFTSLFDAEEGRLGVVVSFLAVLELVKESLIELIQADQFGAIHVRARVRPFAADISEQLDSSG